jgi:hypothetical protein
MFELPKVHLTVSINIRVKPPNVYRGALCQLLVLPDDSMILSDPVGFRLFPVKFGGIDTNRMACSRQMDCI